MFEGVIMWRAVNASGNISRVQTNKQTKSNQTRTYATEANGETCSMLGKEAADGEGKSAMFAWIQTIIYKLTDILSYATIYYRYKLYCYVRRCSSLFRMWYGCDSLLFVSPPFSVLILLQWYTFFILGSSHLVCIELSIQLLSRTYPPSNAWLNRQIPFQWFAFKYNNWLHQSIHPFR